jgi:hypothetical protein
MKLTKQQKQLVKKGVENLIEFGYPDANEKNIFEDAIYSQFFKAMLEENICKLIHTNNHSIVVDMNYLIELIDENRHTL